LTIIQKGHQLVNTTRKVGGHTVYSRTYSSSAQACEPQLSLEGIQYDIIGHTLR
jgi:hypothetical protein